MTVMVDTPVKSRHGQSRLSLIRVLDGAIALAALVLIALTLAGVLAPSLDAHIDPAAVSSDGGHAYTFSPGFAVRWPYAVPSHPDFALARTDVTMTEDGQSIGTIESAHAVIRKLGGGRLNFWESTLWFSPSDDTDARTNGRDYRVEVRSRLAPSVAAIRDWALAALVILALGRAGPAAVRVITGIAAVMDRRLGLGRIPLTFGRTFALASGATLASFAWSGLVRPMPLVLEADSMGYLRPGLVWAAGGDMAGQSTRDLGYPWLTMIAARLGSLAILPELQLLMVTFGLACTLGVLYLGAASLAGRLRRLADIPMWMLAIGSAAAVMVYIAMLSAHSLFMLDMNSAMAEAPHLMPCAVALVLFVGALVARGGRARVIMLALASLAAYASVMFKPHSLLVLALCLVSLMVVALRHWRSFRSPVVIVVSLAAAACATAVHRFDAFVTPPGNDFGPKTLFCNHLDVIEPVFGSGTPERLRILTLTRDVLSRTAGWPVMGFDGDGCMYGADFTAALLAASMSEGTTPGQWELREFEKAVVRNPIGYGRDVARQIWAYLADPTNGMNTLVKSSFTEKDWKTLAEAAHATDIPRDRSDAPLQNWVAQDYPRLAATLQTALRVVSRLFAPVTLGSTILALFGLVRFRRRADIRPEIVLVATALFTAAFIATTAVAHTFDIARYATNVLPFSLLWWMLGAGYLGHLLVLLFVRAASRNARPVPSAPLPVDATAVRSHLACASSVTEPAASSGVRRC